MKQQFQSFRFRSEALRIIERANEVIDLYQARGLRMTARQLYYQFVTRNWLTNEERSYKRLTDTVSRGRLAGLIDWEAIEDRGREPSLPAEFESPQAAVDALVRRYRLCRWHTQPNYVELWVEKQALAGILWPLAYEHHIPLMVNKGYSSQSAMYESATRFKERMNLVESEFYDGDAEYADRKGFLLYLGDHDPSGEDMVRDIRERMAMFGVYNLTVNKVALTMAQIRQLRAPPNPAKITDPRAAKYIQQYGDQSWELDALNPDDLDRIVRDAIRPLVHHAEMSKVKAREEHHRKQLVSRTRNIS